MSIPKIVFLVVLVALGVIIGIAYGWKGLIIYLFLVAIPVIYTIATVVGTGVTRKISAGRFDSESRRSHSPKARDADERT